MKNLLTTTAMIVAFGLPSLAFAQAEATVPAETAPVTDAATDTQMMDNFLSERGQTDMLASELIGEDVYARRTAADAEAAGTDGATMPADGTAMTTMTATDLDSMDNIGQINDIVLATDGSVRAVVIGVGGFLGVGEQDVAVTMDQVNFATDATNPADVYVILNTSGEMLQSSPAFDRAALGGAGVTGATANDPAADANVADTTTADTTMADTTTADTTTTDTAATDMDATGTVAPGTDTTGATATGTAANDQGVIGGADVADGTAMADRDLLTAPAMEREGYAPLVAGDMSLDLLLGKTVYGADDSNVGTVDDVIVDDAGAIQDVIIDFGGFLGIGSTQVALSYEELTILSNDGNADIRVYVDATREQVESMPTYTPVN